MLQERPVALRVTYNGERHFWGSPLNSGSHSPDKSELSSCASFVLMTGWLCYLRITAYFSVSLHLFWILIWNSFSVTTSWCLTGACMFRNAFPARAVCTQRAMLWLDPVLIGQLFLPSAVQEWVHWRKSSWCWLQQNNVSSQQQD